MTRETFALGRALVIGLAVAVGAGLVGSALVEGIRVRQKEQRVTVTGSATRRIRSDFIVWEARVRSQDAALTAAYKKLAADVPAVVEFIEDALLPLARR